jgi:hypothetical protein
MLCGYPSCPTDFSVLLYESIQSRITLAHNMIREDARRVLMDGDELRTIA